MAKSPTPLRVPKRVPKWIGVFCQETDNPDHMTKYTDGRFVAFFEKHFVPPKPREPVDPLKQIGKGFKKLREKLDDGSVDEEEKKTVSQTLSALAEELPEDMRDALGVERTSTPRSSEHRIASLDDKYTETREKMLIATAAGDGDAALRCIDELYDAAVRCVNEGA